MLTIFFWTNFLYNNRKWICDGWRKCKQTHIDIDTVYILHIHGIIMIPIMINNTKSSRHRYRSLCGRGRIKPISLSISSMFKSCSTIHYPQFDTIYKLNDVAVLHLYILSFARHQQPQKKKKKTPFLFLFNCK